MLKAAKFVFITLTFWYFPLLVASKDIRFWSTMCLHSNVPDVSPHPVLRSGQSCPLDWPAPSPTTVAAQVSYRALRPGDE